MNNQNFVFEFVFIIIIFLLSVGSVLAKADDFLSEFDKGADDNEGGSGGDLSSFLSEFNENVEEKGAEGKGFWSSFFALFSDDEEQSVDLGEFEEGFIDTYDLLSVEVRQENCFSGANGKCYVVYYDNKKTNIEIIGYYVAREGGMKLDHYKVWRKKFFFDEEIGIIDYKDGFLYFDVYSEDDSFVEGVSLSELRGIYLGISLIGVYYPKFTEPRLGEDNYIYDGDKRTEYYVKPDLNNLYLIYKGSSLVGGIDKNHVLFVYPVDVVVNIRLTLIKGLCLTEEKTFEECE